ncbi:umecyanin-like [Amaranthus tricolor]|uniref:umecyanin-like n=1 Tax=Amaranthus tricolor TaxID=29722 RepID=UPI0025851B48|nr:umecyanin-like [Amaranthus tricolor]
MATKRIVLPLLVVVYCVLVQSSSALIHVVGGVAGWEIPPNKTFYEDWAKPRTFGVGDKLVFPYRMGAHNVLQVNKADFDKCGHDNVINQFFKGPTVFQLNAIGDYYFYSGVGIHCEMGQKLHVQVVPGKGYSGRGTRFLQFVSRRLWACPGLKSLLKN